MVACGTATHDVCFFSLVCIRTHGGAVTQIVCYMLLPSSWSSYDNYIVAVSGKNWTLHNYFYYVWREALAQQMFSSEHTVSFIALLVIMHKPQSPLGAFVCLLKFLARGYIYKEHSAIQSFHHSSVSFLPGTVSPTVLFNTVEVTYPNPQ